MENPEIKKVKMATTTVVEINSPKTCGSCNSKKLQYKTEDYSGIRDTYWMCGCGWEDFGATYSIKKNVVEHLEIPDIEEFLDLEIIKRVGERGKDKSPRIGRTDKGQARGPNKRTLAKAMVSKRGKSKSGKSKGGK